MIDGFEVLMDESDGDQFGDRSESGFEAKVNINEGVNGRKRIDTTYENTSETLVQRPRSDYDDNVSLRGQSVKDSTVRHSAPEPVDLFRFPHRRF